MQTVTFFSWRTRRMWRDLRCRDIFKTTFIYTTHNFLANSLSQRERSRSRVRPRFEERLIAILTDRSSRTETDACLFRTVWPYVNHPWHYQDCTVCSSFALPSFDRIFYYKKPTGVSLLCMRLFSLGSRKIIYLWSRERKRDWSRECPVPDV